MSKTLWNYGASIPIDSLSQEQRKEAIKEWAEGNAILEELLLKCYENGVKTTGSHTGHTGCLPYVGMLIDESNFKSLNQLLMAALSLEGTNTQVIFSGYNVRSGPNWYKSMLTFGISKRTDANRLFDSLSSSLNENKEVNDDVTKSFFNIYDFLKDKSAPLEFRIYSK